MEELLGLRFLTTTLNGSIDWTALIAFLVISLVAFLCPVVGYEPRRPKGIAAALLLLIGYMLIGIFEYCVLWFGFYDQAGGNNARPGRGGIHESSTSWFFVFSVVKLIVFVVALLTFALGVLALRLRKPIPRPEPYAVELEDK